MWTFSANKYMDGWIGGALNTGEV